MSHVTLKDLFLRLQEQMIAQLTTNREILSHPGTKGDASEINWLVWLKTYLPKRYEVGKAFVVDSENAKSEQIDIVIYDRHYSPFIFNQDGAVYVPAESVYAVFEVKQELNKQHVEYAGKKAKSVRSLKRTTTNIPHAGGIYPPKHPPDILAGILTLDSAWNPPLGERFDKCVRDTGEQEKLDMGCVLKHGSFVISGDKKTIKKCYKDETLIFFFLNLIIQLQKRGTVPAIDIETYAQALDSFQ